ncbi:triphosphoribosyl-dephospho-CoA synthase [Marinifilum sp. RC60d5]|uniref:triphosphoribosyl-dephospho-CoA synthase n=1 Tax=Marinifilum sp. RC60d5 TaxID=3458414 RepID=UPI0040350956
MIKEILAAKDQRAEARIQIANQKKASLSFNLNVPGYPKSNDKIKSFFEHTLKDLKRYLLSHRIVIEQENEQCKADEAGDFYIVPLTGNISVCQIKELAESFEIKHPLGRLLDIDITNSEGSPVSSGKAKVCYFCNQQAAIVCMREKAHSYEDMRNKIDRDISCFMESVRQDRLCNFLSATALKALLHEVSLSPKPGLVDRFSNGSHQDMDFSTFLNSSAVLSVYFKDIAQYGFIFNQENPKDALPELRRIGLLMEEDMFRETQGVNTHKGAIFLLGFSLFISANLIAKNKFSYSAFADQLKKLNGNLVEQELGKKLYSKAKTHGEECFEKYGSKGLGIRGEVQSGLPCVFNHAIPILSTHLKGISLFTDSLLQKSLSHTLLALIANNNDSNILFRKGIEVLEQLKDKARIAFNSFNTNKFNSDYKDLRDYCNTENISPGGSADLLAVSFFIYMVNQDYN